MKGELWGDSYKNNQIERIFVCGYNFFGLVSTLKSGENLQKCEIVKWTKWSWNGTYHAIIGEILAQKNNF